MQDKVTRMHRVKAVAEAFDVSVHTIYRAIRSGELDALKVGGSIRIPDEALTAYREACAEAAHQEFVIGDGDPSTVDGAGRGGDVTVAYSWEHGPLNREQARGDACVLCGVLFATTGISHTERGTSSTGDTVWACRSHPANQVRMNLLGVAGLR